jgi:aspartate ammonia-lyase
MKYRKEKDTMGTILVPENAYYGPQTQRAAENFPIGDLKLKPGAGIAGFKTGRCDYGGGPGGR